MPEAPASNPSARPEGLRADAARNRARVLAAAREQVTEGAAALAMNTLARTAEVGVGTVYRHFPTRQVLLEALAVDSLEALALAAEQAATEPDAASGLEALLRAGLRSQLTDPALAAVLGTPDLECTDSRELGARLAAATDRLLTRAREDRVVRDDVSSDDVRRLLSGLERSVSAGRGRVASSARYLQVVLQGLRPPADGAAATG